MRSIRYLIRRLQPWELAGRLQLLFVVLAIELLNIEAAVGQSIIPTSVTTVPGDIAPRYLQDGAVDAADLLLLQRFISGEVEPIENELYKADIAPLGSPDGELDAGDLVVMLRALMGEINIPAKGPVVPDIDRVITYVHPGSSLLRIPAGLYISGGAGTVLGGYDVEVIVTYPDQVQVRTVRSDVYGGFLLKGLDEGATKIELRTIGNGELTDLVSRAVGNPVQEGLNSGVLACWNGLKQSLLSGDINSAVATFAESVRERYMDQLNLIGNIEVLPGYWSNLAPIKISEDYAEYVLRQAVNGVERMHLVGFSRNDEGDWVIENF